MGRGKISSTTKYFLVMKVSSSDSNIVVLDIGKTHAKVILFNTLTLKETLIFQRKNLIINEPPYPHFDVEALKRFIIKSLNEITKSYSVESVFTSTHGASAAFMANGDLVLPILDYDFEGPETVRTDYDKLRPRFNQTGSPKMDAGLNLGAQIFWLNKTFRSKFEKVEQILFWPQFWSHWLSGVACSEISYASSHSDLWDICKNDFIDLRKFGLSSKVRFPPMKKAWEQIGGLRKELSYKTGLLEGTPILCGAHDSSVNLATPFLKGTLPCTMLSSGTWITLFSLGTSNFNFKDQTGLMLTNDCFGNLVPNFRFPAGKIYQDVLEKERTGEDDFSLLDWSSIRLVDYASAQKARFVNSLSSQEIDLSKFSLDSVEKGISNILAQETLNGLAAIDAKGPLIASGPFLHNQNYINFLKKEWHSQIISEKDHLSLCTGVASLIEHGYS